MAPNLSRSLNFLLVFFFAPRFSKPISSKKIQYQMLRTSFSVGVYSSLFGTLLLVGLGPSVALNLLVFGGTGFIGQNIVRTALARGHRVVSLSRRGGAQAQESNPEAIYLTGDATDIAACRRASSEGPFDGFIHCVGLLLDSDSRLSGLNRLASGSGSIPSADSTYDRVTRLTAFNMLEVCAAQPRPQSASPLPFVFISAAEAAWTFQAPVGFLERYLVAKRQVENRLLESSAIVRPTILRPSLVWTPDRPQALVSVIPFFVANAVGIPFIDRPVTVQTLALAALTSIENSAVSGIKKDIDIEELARRKAI